MGGAREVLRRFSFRPQPIGRSGLIVLGLISLGALVLRVHGLGAQSFWYDETLTVQVSGSSLRHVFDAVPEEASPPLYYLLAWVWMKAFGTGEEALRSLSVIAGLGAIPLVLAAARRVVSANAALAAAALVAVNPMLVWYSQEGRNYALLVLLAALTLWLALRAAEQPSARRLGLWSVSCCFALLVHYFAFFIIVPEAGILLLSAGASSRPRFAALVLPGLVGLALVPLAHAQAGDVNFIDAMPIGDRLVDLGREVASTNIGLITESTHRPPALWLWPTVAVVAVAVGSLVLRRPSRDRAGAAMAGAVTLFILVVPAALSATSLDFFFDRNLIAAWIPLLIVLGAGFAAVRPAWLGTALLGVLCALGVGVDVKVASDPLYQREDWRTLVHAMGEPVGRRAVVVKPSYAVAPLEVYGRDVAPIRAGTKISEIDLIGRLTLAAAAPPSIPGFADPEITRVPGLRLLRYRALAPFVVSGALIEAAQGEAESVVLVERPGG